ncbi:hypothetical protein SAMN05192533_102269 [Mesobacillus persicus]|uniref:Uncharacterized protein n=1 Tax=Mesobacillus persicus TaxID=930146 RepID=A0A1H7XLW9_9BACI|nr:hypothetical protein [Mesobacillus persicus]SEM34770.1 hypothetical protein SAMN05192533_102269 [Mesobacillus persicus]
MILELNEKKYMAPPAKAKLFRKALVITKEYDLDNLTADTLDEVLFFVCEVFNNQFSLEDIYEYVDGRDLVKLVIDSIKHVVGQTTGEEDSKKK